MERVIFLIQRSYSSQATEKALITVPKYVSRHIEKVQAREVKRREVLRRKIICRGDLSIPVITSNKKEYNYYLGQEYAKNIPVPILSRYWFKTKSAGQKFTIIPWSNNPSLPRKLKIPEQLSEWADKSTMADYISEFSQLDLSSRVIDGLHAMGIDCPTPVQTLAIPKILEHKNILCVAETGCGKTMAYVTPIVENLIMYKKNIQRFTNTPLALIVTPGRELAEQVAKVAHQLGEACEVSVKCMIPEGTKFPHLVPHNDVEIDILVATFGTISKLVSKNVYYMAQLRHLVLDEADTLLDDSFKELMEPFLQQFMVPAEESLVDGKPSGTQITLVSSTMPSKSSLLSSFDAEFEPAISPHRHRILPHVEQKFIRVSNQNRAGVFLELAKNNFKKSIPTMVFCNKSPACDWISDFLKDNDVPHVKFHAGMTYQEREDSFERFQSGDIDIFCCTDLASRGLDTQRAKHVINFDFPNNVSDYILRVGRVGRVGTNHGRVTSLIVSVPGVYVVQDIEAAIRRSTKLQHVDANIKQKIHKLHFSP